MSALLAFLRRYGLILLLLAAAAAVVASGAWRHLSLSELKDRRQDLVAFVGRHPLESALAYLATYTVVVGVSLPGALIMSLSAGFLFGPWFGGLAAVTGALSGSTVMYAACRTAFGDLIRRRGGGWLARLQAGFSANAFDYLLTLRLIPAFPLLIVNAGAGVLRVPLGTFLLASILGMAPSSFVYAGIGAGLGVTFARGEELDLSILAHPAVFGPLIGLCVLALLPVIYRRWRGRVAAGRPVE